MVIIVYGQNGLISYSLCESAVCNSDYYSMICTYHSYATRESFVAYQVTSGAKLQRVKSDVQTSGLSVWSNGMLVHTSMVYYGLF